MHSVDLLTADHNRVRGLFTRWRRAHEATEVAEMRKLVDKIVEELTVHTTIEEEVFYPEVRGVDHEIGEKVDEGLQEHHLVKILIDELGALEAGSDEWIAKVTVLIENVEHHAEEEEQDMFPPLRRQITGPAALQLAEALEARKAALGAPVLADKIELTKEQLLELARAQEIPGRSDMDHEELAATVAPH